MDRKSALKLLKESPKRLPCELCNHYDSDTNECDIGNDMDEDNDPIQGCWNFL